MTYAWSDVTRNAGIRKTIRATRYVGLRVAGCALCYRVVTYYLYAQESFHLGERVTLTTGNSLSVYATLTNRPPAIRHIRVNIDIFFGQNSRYMDVKAAGTRINRWDVRNPKTLALDTRSNAFRIYPLSSCEVQDP